MAVILTTLLGLSVVLGHFLCAMGAEGPSPLGKEVVGGLDEPSLSSSLIFNEQPVEGFYEPELGVWAPSHVGYGYGVGGIKRNFNPWGGKRSVGPAGPAGMGLRFYGDYGNPYFKRGTFNAWGGKRQDGGQQSRSTKSDSSGSRTLPFNPWGGR